MVCGGVAPKFRRVQPSKDLSRLCSQFPEIVNKAMWSDGMDGINLTRVNSVPARHRQHGRSVVNMAAPMSLSTSHSNTLPPQVTPLEQELLQEYTKLVSNMNAVSLLSMHVRRRVANGAGVDVNCRYGRTADVAHTRCFTISREEDGAGVYFLQGQCLCYGGTFLSPVRRLLPLRSRQ